MRYGAILSKDGKDVLATFPGCPGLVTGGPADEIESLAADALVGWLETHLDMGGVPPVPRRTVTGLRRRVIWVEVPAILAAKIALRRARIKAGLTQTQLARKAGVSQPMIAKLENPDIDIQLGTLAKIAKVLGVTLEVKLERARNAA